MSEQKSPYEDARDKATNSLRTAGQYRKRLDSRGQSVTAEPDHAMISVAYAILALAEAIRPQPPEVHVTVTEAVVSVVAEATREVRP